MQANKQRFVVLALATLIVLTSNFQHAALARYDHDGSASHSSAFNDEYIFATTRGLNEMEGVHPALKITLIPATVILDTAFLPFAVIAGFIG